MDKKFQIFSNTQEKDWFYNEVLPSILRHGIYLTPEKIDDILSEPEKAREKALKLCMDLKSEQISWKN
jgi:prophage antirepressor-like protein